MTFFAALLMLLLQVPQTANDPTGAISGRVADESGRPIAGVPVVIRQSGYGSDGERALHHAGRGITNDRGEYRIFGLKPGAYYALAASAEQTFEEYLRESGTPVAWDEILGSGYVPTYYPQGTDPASARTLNVGPGSELRSIDFTLIRQPVFRVRGRLPDNGTKLEPDLIWLVSKTRTDGAGSIGGEVSGSRFEIENVVPGSYWIRANSGEVPLLMGSVDVFHGDVDNVVFDRIRGFPVGGFAIEGHVRFEGRTPSLHPEHRPQLNLAPKGESIDDRSTLINGDGTFAFSGVIPGVYRFWIGSLPPDTYIKSARRGDSDVLNTLTVSGPVTDLLEVLLSTRAGQIDGTVTDKDGKPKQNAVVVLLPVRQADRIPARVKVTGSDQNSHFIIQAIAPGDYLLFAWENLEPYRYYDPEFVRELEALGLPVKVSEDSTQKVQLRVIPAQ
jgi:hypothetical protein